MSDISIHQDEPGGVINLDCLEIGELNEIAGAIEASADTNAESLFPGREGNLEVVKLIGQYANCKAEAMRCRRRGATASACQFEQDCEAIYNQLPDWARW